MFTLTVRDRAGKSVGSIVIERSLLGEEVRVELLHRACLMYEANKRAGTACAKTRSEVAGSRAKMYRQKGTGRARRGTKQAPILIGGGVAHGPRPRDYSYDIGKKSRRNALKSALLSKFEDNEVLVIDELGMDAPRTREASEILFNLDIYGKVAVVLKLYPKGDAEYDRKNLNIARSFRNLPGVRIISEHDLNAYEVMRAGDLLFTQEALEALKGRL